MRGFQKVEHVATTDQRLPMSSLIDVVFLLLVFFVMTFRVAPQEGEFAMQPAAAAAAVADGAGTTNVPLRLELDATAEGLLAEIRLNGQAVANFEELQLRLIRLASDGGLQDVEMTLDCDPRLKYEQVVAALDHVTAYRDSTGQRQPLVESTRLAVRN